MGPQGLATAGALLVAAVTVYASGWRMDARAPATSPAPTASGVPSVSNAGPGGSALLWDTDEVAGYTTGVPMRPMDREIIAALRAGTPDRAAMLDRLPGRPYQVRLAGSAELHQIRFVLLDLDRDGRWDERWDLGQPGQIERHLTPGGDAGVQDVVFTLTHGRWQAH